MTEKKILLFALCICAKDGLISSTEEKALLSLFNEFVKIKGVPFKRVSNSSFEEIIHEFFSTTNQLEDYVKDIKNSEYLEKILEIAKNAASSDGFDILENIAYKKTLALLDMN
jgi:hypothetical protein